MTPTNPLQTAAIDPRDEILASLARTRATCAAIRQRAVQVHTSSNLDMIGRLNLVCELWVEMVVDARRTWHAARLGSLRVA